jgi:hypothetical protein
MQFQALPGSPLPDQLRQLGWRVERTGTSERILPHAVSQRFETSSSGHPVDREQHQADVDRRHACRDRERRAV